MNNTYFTAEQPPACLYAIDQGLVNEMHAQGRRMFEALEEVIEGAVVHNSQEHRITNYAMNLVKSALGPHEGPNKSLEKGECTRCGCSLPHATHPSRRCTLDEWRDAVANSEFKDSLARHEDQ